MLPIKLLSASRPYSIAPFRPLDEAGEERLARQLSGCDVPHRDRLAALADLRRPRTLPQRLRLVAITDRVTLL